MANKNKLNNSADGPATAAKQKYNKQQSDVS